MIALRAGTLLAVFGVCCPGSLGCGEQTATPAITAIVPDRASVGDTVDLVGRFAGQDRLAAFSGTDAEVAFWNSSRARVTVPDVGPGLVPVVVTVDGQPSAPFDFVVQPPP